jgi:hypothetical protein
MADAQEIELVFEAKTRADTFTHPTFLVFTLRR